MKFLCLADTTNKSQNGLFNVVGIFDQIYLKELPGIHPMMHLAVFLETEVGDTGKHKCEFEIIAPSGTSMARGGADLSSPEHGENTEPRVGLPLPGIPIHELGLHTVKFSVDGGEPAIAHFVAKPLKSGK